MKTADNSVGHTVSSAETSKRRIVIDIGARETKIFVCGGELKRESNGVLMMGDPLFARPVGVGITRVFVSPYRWHEILNPFANLDSVKKHFDAAVYFIVEMVRQYCPQEGLSRLLKSRIEVAVALPEWMMGETELVVRFYAEVTKKLKSYRVTFVNSRAALCAYARQKRNRANKQGEGETK